MSDLHPLAAVDPVEGGPDEPHADPVALDRLGGPMDGLDGLVHGDFHFCCCI